MAINKFIVSREDRDIAGATYSAYRLTPVTAVDGVMEKSFLALVPKGSPAALVLEDPANQKVNSLYLTLTKGEPPYILDAMSPWKYEFGIPIKVDGVAKTLTGDEALTTLSLEHMRWSVMHEQLDGLAVLRTNPDKQKLFNHYAQDFVSAQIATDVETLNTQIKSKGADIQEALAKELPKGFPPALMPAVTVSVLKGSRLSSDPTKGNTYNFDIAKQTFTALHEWAVAEREGSYPSGSDLDMNTGKARDLQLAHLRKLGMSPDEAVSYFRDYEKLSLQSKRDLVTLFQPSNSAMLEKVSRLNVVRQSVSDLVAAEGSKAGETLLINQVLCQSDPVKLESARMGLAQHDPKQALPDGLLAKLTDLAPRELLREADVVGNGDYTTENGKLTLTPIGVATMTTLMQSYRPAIAMGLAQVSSPEFATVVAARAAELKSLENTRDNMQKVLSAHLDGAFDRRDTVESVLGQDRQLLPATLEFDVGGQAYKWVQGAGTQLPDGSPASVDAHVSSADGRQYALDKSGLLRRMMGPPGDVTTANGRLLTQQPDGRVSLVGRDGETTDFPDLVSAGKSLGDDSFVGSDNRDYTVKDGQVLEHGSQRYNLMADSALDCAEIRKGLTANTNGVSRSNAIVDFYTQKALQLTLAHQTQNTPAASHVALTTAESNWTHWKPKTAALTMADENFFFRDAKGKWVPKQDFLNMSTSMNKYVANQIMAQMSGQVFGKTTQEGPPLNAEMARRMRSGMGADVSLENAVVVTKKETEKGLENCEERIDQRDFTLFREYGAALKAKKMAMLNMAATVASLVTVAAGFGFSHMAKDMEH